MAWYERAVWSVRGQNGEDVVKLVGYVVVVLQCKGSSIRCWGWVRLINTFSNDRVNLSSLSRSQDLRNVSMCLQLSMWYSPDSYIYISRHLKVLQPLRSLAATTCSSQSLSDASDIPANQRLPSRPGKKQRNRKELSIIQGLILETTMKYCICHYYKEAQSRSSIAFKCSPTAFEVCSSNYIAELKQVPKSSRCASCAPSAILKTLPVLKIVMLALDTNSTRVEKQK